MRYLYSADNSRRPTPKKAPPADAKARLDLAEQVDTEDWAADAARRDRKPSPEAAKLLREPRSR